MPKSSKHKKERAADFKKAKLKLGKGKQIANNATNTSFSAKTIALPNQSLHEAPKDVPTSRRNLTLPELLVQSRHYSVPVKREALTEILQLVTSHPYLLNQNLLPMITSIAHLIADASPSVRAASLNLLRHISDSLPAQSIVSVSQGLVLFTLSALSNLDEAIRIDALKVLDLLIEKIPEEIVRGWDGGADVHSQLGKSSEEKGTGSKVVEGLLGMLKIRNPALTAAQGNFTSASSSDLSPSARLAVLTTLAAFLRTSLSPIASTSTAPPPWYLTASFDSPRAYSSFLGSFGYNSSAPVIDTSKIRSIPIERFDLADLSSSSAKDLSHSSFSLYTPSISNPSFASTSSAASTNSPPQTLLTLLHPTLLSSFLDAAPTAFSPSPQLGQHSSAQSASSELQTITAVLRVARELFYRNLGGNHQQESEEFSTGATIETGTGGGVEKVRARKLLATLLNHAAPYFPFGMDELQLRTGQEEEELLQLNLTFSELVSLLVLSEEAEGDSTIGGGGGKSKKDLKKSSKSQSDSSKLELILSKVENWVIQALECSLVSSSNPLGLPALSHQAFLNLEPTLWSLLNQNPHKKRSIEGEGVDNNGLERVWRAVLKGWGKMGKESEARKRVFEFIARCILVQSDPSYRDRFDLETISSNKNRESVAETGEWISKGLSKWLWELGNKRIETTELVIDFLLRLAQQGSKGVLPISTLNSLCLMLVPFFHLTHPTRGSLPGPFTRLNSIKLESKCLDLVYYLLSLPTETQVEEEGKNKLKESVERALAGGKKGNQEILKTRWKGLMSDL
ncbi:hypothetical protein JCM3765_003475 [Sporobolomyces pararoseus]